MCVLYISCDKTLQNRTFSPDRMITVSVAVNESNTDTADRPAAAAAAAAADARNIAVSQ